MFEWCGDEVVYELGVGVDVGGCDGDGGVFVVWILMYVE